MELTAFKALVTKVGEDHILGVAFDNTGSKFFTKENPFVLSEHLDEALECLVFEDRDTFKHPYKIYKPLETVQTVFVTEPELRTKINTRSVF